MRVPQLVPIGLGLVVYLGLTVANVDVVLQAVASNMLGSMGLLAGAIRSPLQQPTRRQSDSDSEDFEFINSEELNNQ